MNKTEIRTEINCCLPKHPSPEGRKLQNLPSVAGALFDCSRTDFDGWEVDGWRVGQAFREACKDGETGR